MISPEKFVQKFNEFASNEELNDLSMDAKVNLFKAYLDTIKPTPQPSGAGNVADVAKSSNQTRIRKPNRPATDKQIGFLKKLVREGKLDEVDFDDLTVGEASALIEKGVKSKPKPKPEPEEEPEGEFTGSYHHSSGSVASTQSFWD